MGQHKRQNQLIINAFLQKDEGAIGQFYKEQWPRIVALVISLGGTENAAKDVMQDGMMFLFEKVKKGDYINQDSASISTYFQRICRYLWLNKRRSAHSRKVSSIDMLDIKEKGSEMRLEMEMIEEQHKFNQFFNLLGDKCQKLLIAFYWEERSIKEISDLLNLTYESAKNAKYRCMERLKKILVQKSANR